ncbi:hypothetical protein WMY93_008226 [Mugilogobius chulae]|uniref:Uncharacterized protein n=1 Tax=Mugilogobius chulae TaxID=88201 RepID=A0AAW0PFF1_9GOBI
MIVLTTVNPGEDDCKEGVEEGLSEAAQAAACLSPEGSERHVPTKQQDLVIRVRVQDGPERMIHVQPTMRKGTAQGFTIAPTKVPKEVGRGGGTGECLRTNLSEKE